MAIKENQLYPGYNISEEQKAEDKKRHKVNSTFSIIMAMKENQLYPGYNVVEEQKAEDKKKHKHPHRHVPIHREARTRLLFDETPTTKGKKDNGKYYRCWKCGQICHDKEHSLGGRKSGDAKEYSDFTTESTGIVPGNAQSAYSILVHVEKLIASLKLDSNGDVQGVVHNHNATGGGCPQCHSLNYAGFYP